MTTTITDLGTYTTALAVVDAHPDLTIPQEFISGLNYWPKTAGEGLQIQEALNEAHPGKLAWEQEKAVHSRHILLRGWVGGRRRGEIAYTIWVPDLT